MKAGVAVLCALVLLGACDACEVPGQKVNGTDVCQIDGKYPYYCKYFEALKGTENEYMPQRQTEVRTTNVIII